MRARLPATFLPKHYKLVAELPFTPTNKLDVRAVRAMFESDADR